MGNTCIPVADSCRCMAKPIQYCKVSNNNNNNLKNVKNHGKFSEKNIKMILRDMFSHISH